MAKYQLLHLSDLHIGTAGGWGTWPLKEHNQTALCALAEFIYNVKDRIDVICISGDIVSNGGRGGDLLEAKRFFTDAPSHPTKGWFTSNNKPTIGFFKKPIIIMPGNHDRYQSRSGNPGNRLFDEWFASYWPASHGGVCHRIISKNGQPPLAIVAGDFTLFEMTSKPPLGHYGQGIVDYRIDAMKAETVRIRQMGYNSIVWMVHFAPEIQTVQKFKNNISSYQLACLELLCSNKLSSAAIDVNVNHVFCGHTHVRNIYQTSINPGLTVHCAGTSVCVDKKNDTTVHLRFIDVAATGIIDVNSYQASYIASPLSKFGNIMKEVP